MKSLLLAALLCSLPLQAFVVVHEEIDPESVLREMNQERVLARLPPLRLDERLNRAAEDRMRDMEEMGYWSHNSPDGLSPFVWMKPRGYEFSNAGENLATGFDTVTVLVDSWMESSGHRRNILSPDFDEVGVAVIEGKTTGRGSGRSIVVLFARERFTPIRHSVAGRRERGLAALGPRRRAAVAPFHRTVIEGSISADQRSIPPSRFFTL